MGGRMTVAVNVLPHAAACGTQKVGVLDNVISAKTNVSLPYLLSFCKKLSKYSNRLLKLPNVIQKRHK
jgi:hypothetical protein